MKPRGTDSRPAALLRTTLLLLSRSLPARSSSSTYVEIITTASPHVIHSPASSSYCSLIEVKLDPIDFAVVRRQR